MIPRSSSGRWIAIVLAAHVCSVAPARPTAADSLEQIVAAELREEYSSGCFRFAEVELDGRSPAEILVLLLDREWCGTGGCSAVVYRRIAGGLLEVGSIALVDDVRVSRSPRAGWRDLYVENRHGSWLLRFDGRTYPENPTVAPATPAKIPASARPVTWRRSSGCR